MALNLAIQKVPLKLFKCEHNYHHNCLKENLCPRCIKKAVEIEAKETQKKKGRNDSLSTASGNSADSSKNLAQMQAQAELAFQSSPSERAQVQQQLGNQLLIKRMEVFDSTLELQGLTRANFL